MNCSRCQAVLPDSATFCPTCGTSTQPGQPGFSYLPAGTPPWPSIVPQTSPFAQAASAAKAAEHTSTRSEKKAGISGRSILVAIAVIILVPLIGAVATLGSLYAKGQFPPNTSPQSRVVLPAKATPTAASAASAGATDTPAASASTQGNQLPTPTSRRTINSSDLNISLKYPSTWVTDPANKSTDSTSMTIHPQQALGIGFIAVRFSDTTSATITSPDEINQARVQAIQGQQGISNVQVVSPAAGQPKIGGDTWKQVEAVFQDSAGNKIHMITISEQHKKAYYNLVIFSPDGVYTEAMQKYIQPMLDSLQFLS